MSQVLPVPPAEFGLFALLGGARSPAPHRRESAGSRGPEFADLALRPTLRELGLALPANERAPGRARLPLRALIGPAAGKVGLAGGGRECPARVGVARAPPSPPCCVFSLLPPPSLAPRLRPRAGGALHCTLWGRRSVRGMGQRAAAGGRNPRAARVSRGGLPGRAQKETGLMPAARTDAWPGPTGE